MKRLFLLGLLLIPLSGLANEISPLPMAQITAEAKWIILGELSSVSTNLPPDSPGDSSTPAAALKPEELPQVFLAFYSIHVKKMLKGALEKERIDAFYKMYNPVQKLPDGTIVSESPIISGSGLEFQARSGGEYLFFLTPAREETIGSPNSPVRIASGSFSVLRLENPNQQIDMK